MEGIVVNNVDYKESSSIAILYTENGRISVRCNGSKRPSSKTMTFTTIGSINEFEATSSAMPALLEHISVFSPFSIQDLNKLNVLGTIIDIVNKIPEDANHKIIYPFIRKAIISINNYNEYKILSILLIKLLFAFGVNPNLKECAICKSKDVKFFNIYNAGAGCINHIAEDTLDIWTNYYYKKLEFDEYLECDYDSLLDDIYKYYELHANIKLKKYKMTK